MSEQKMLKTEMRNPDTTNIDRMTTAGMLECIQRENENAVFSVRKALSEIEIACDLGRIYDSSPAGSGYSQTGHSSG